MGNLLTIQDIKFTYPPGEPFGKSGTGIPTGQSVKCRTMGNTFGKTPGALKITVRPVPVTAAHGVTTGLPKYSGEGIGQVRVFGSLECVISQG